MSVKHTPGPWTVHQEVPGAPCRILGPTEHGRGSIASCLEPANAKLIAAAPALADALEALVRPQLEAFKVIGQPGSPMANAVAALRAAGRLP